MCFTVAAFIATRHPLRHPLQIIVTVGQIYGLVLYYATHTFDYYHKEVNYSRPEFLYFWFYYFFMNFLWMIFPGSKSSLFRGKFQRWLFHYSAPRRFSTYYCANLHRARPGQEHSKGQGVCKERPINAGNYGRRRIQEAKYRYDTPFVIKSVSPSTFQKYRFQKLPIDRCM